MQAPSFFFCLNIVWVIFLVVRKFSGRMNHPISGFLRVVAVLVLFFFFFLFPERRDARGCVCVFFFVW